MADLRGAVSAQFDARAHARAVLERLDRAPAAEPKPRRATWFVGAVAAGILLAAGYGGLRAPSSKPAWQSRGGSAQAAIGRDVGVQPYAVEGALRPLVSGSTIDASMPLTAGFRNLGEAPAFLLLFGVDAQSVVHWISPAYTRSDDDPASTRLSGSTREQILGATVVFDDVRAGPLRLIAVITSAPAHVSDVESLAGTDLSAARLTGRLHGAEVRETIRGCATQLRRYAMTVRRVLLALFAVLIVGLTAPPSAPPRLGPRSRWSSGTTEVWEPGGPIFTMPTTTQPSTSPSCKPSPRTTSSSSPTSTKTPPVCFPPRGRARAPRPGTNCSARAET